MDVWERPSSSRLCSTRPASVDLVRRLDDEGFDDGIRRETDEALELTGKDVGTPIIHFRPPDGVAFFGPVISRLPDEESAVRLWDHGRAGGAPASPETAQPARGAAPPALGMEDGRSVRRRTGTRGAGGGRSERGGLVGQA